MKHLADASARATEAQQENPHTAPVASWARDYAEDLKRFLAKRRFIESDIKDVCQEVYLRLLRFDRIATVKNPAAYLFRVAANVAHDFRLRRQDWAPLEDQDLNNLSSNLTAEELAVTAARHSVLLKAIENLPPLPRATLALQLKEDISHEEIANRLGISRRAVRKAVARGHELLRAALIKDVL